MKAEGDTNARGQSSDRDHVIVGGGAKKILYTLKTVQRIGVKKSAKALTSHNTCKACGLGMGGQRGGMVNEMGEFPSVCNKSVQAQSTDIQPAIPVEVFQHSIADFRELSGHNLEHMGRLNNPLYKSKDSDKYKPVEWDWALKYAADKLAETDPNRSFMYSSGRSSNEAGFVLQLLARLYGTNNVNNCSYYCHQATGVGLGNTIGTGTATVVVSAESVHAAPFAHGDESHSSRSMSQLPENVVDAEFTTVHSASYSEIWA